MLDHIGVILERLGAVDQMYQKVDPPLRSWAGGLRTRRNCIVTAAIPYTFSIPTGRSSKGRTNRPPVNQNSHVLRV